MVEIIKITIRKFKENIYENITVSLMFSFLTFLSILIGYLLVKDIGILLSFIALIIPMIIGLKYITYYAYNHLKFDYKLAKIGFMTYFKSIRV